MIVIEKLMKRNCLLSILIIICVLDNEQACETPEGLQGKCVNIKQCRSVLLRLKARPVPREFYENLQRANCGFEKNTPKICCALDSTKSVTKSESPVQSTSSPIKVVAPRNSWEVIDNHPNLKLLEDDICGPTIETKIFGGNETSILEFPWMALLAYDVGLKNLEFLCGGTIINKRYILTAAHCLTNLPDRITLKNVRIGDYNLALERDCETSSKGEEIICAEKYQILGIEKIVIHSEYDKSTFYNDIALVRLNRNIDFLPANVKPICLPLDPNADTALKSAVVTGWGATRNGPSSDVLMKVTVPIVSNAKCAQIYRHQLAPIWHKQICAGGETHKDSCKGDSGGPLQNIGRYKDDIRMIHLGIVSFGFTACGLSKIPGIYTRVTSYMQWILDNIHV